MCLPVPCPEPSRWCSYDLELLQAIAANERMLYDNRTLSTASAFQAGQEDLGAHVEATLKKHRFGDQRRVDSRQKMRCALLRLMDFYVVRG